ncbi:hypothetical protein ACTJJ0_11095 [Chitinophaga sp. 22321]|uniref:hypothetical protein n=1 Tax=Chitinophaga sp. 22321 TaxID=3453909 RepID=UPI003F851412
MIVHYEIIFGIEAVKKLYKYQLETKSDKNNIITTYFSKKKIAITGNNKFAQYVQRQTEKKELFYRHSLNVLGTELRKQLTLIEPNHFIIEEPDVPRLEIFLKKEKLETLVKKITI